MSVRFTNNVRGVYENVFFSVVANEDFELRKIDIRAAFLQAKQLDRDVFLRPPKDIRKEGMIWKQNKTLIWFE